MPADRSSTDGVVRLNSYRTLKATVQSLTGKVECLEAAQRIVQFVKSRT